MGVMESDICGLTDVCRLTGGGGDLWWSASHLTRASGGWVRLAGGTFQLH